MQYGVSMLKIVRFEDNVLGFVGTLGTIQSGICKIKCIPFESFSNCIYSYRTLQPFLGDVIICLYDLYYTLGSRHAQIFAQRSLIVQITLMVRIGVCKQISWNAAISLIKIKLASLYDVRDRYDDKVKKYILFLNNLIESHKFNK